MRKSCVEFLKNYSDEILSEIIPNVFEIGVLTLKNSFHKMIFSKDELRDIIYDLRKNYYDDNIYLKSINEIRKQQKEKNFKNLMEPQINKDEIERGIYSGKRRFKQDKEIYPNWWWDQKEENINYDNNINNNNYHYNNTMNKNNFNNNYYNEYDDENNKKRKNSGCERRIKMNLLSKGDIDDNENNNLKKNNKKNNETYNSKYHYHKEKINSENNNINNNKINKKKMNYKISYDKDLKPEEIKRKGKEPDYQYSYYKGNIERTPSEGNINEKNNNNNY